MSHYATLNKYRFDADVDDIRGAKLFGEGSQQLGKIHDVVFDHATGDIRYFVVAYGHERRVLVPLDHVFRTVVDEDSFSTDLTSDDLEHLPAFDAQVLENDRQWRNYEKLHRSSMKDRIAARQQVEKEYQAHWTEDPVQHREGAPAHDITPAPRPPERSKVTPIDRGRRHERDYVPDVTPHRLAPVFGDTRNSSEKLGMVPQAGSSSGPASEYTTAGFGPKWNGFAERIKRDLVDIRGKCERCDDRDTRAA